MGELELVSKAFLHPMFAPIPLLAGLTGLRPPCGKQSRSSRAVPLPVRASEALAALPPRVDTPLLFPAQKGGHLSLHNGRADHWTPAFRATGWRTVRQAFTALEAQDVRRFGP